VRRWRDSRAGELREVGSGPRDLRTARFMAFFFGALLTDLTAIFRFDVRRALLGRLAERVGRPAFFAVFLVALRPLVFRLAMASVPFGTLTVLR
jgi:hypothetical protein